MRRGPSWIHFIGLMIAWLISTTWEVRLAFQLRNANEGWSRCLDRPMSFTRGGLLIEPTMTNTQLHTAWTCGWHSPEAQAWIHWRDFELHGAHEDREGLVCESNKLWTTWLQRGTMGGDGEGFLMTPHGVGAYLGRLCRAIEPRDRIALVCDESKARGSSQCRERPGFFSFAGDTVSAACFSTDPKGCL